MTFLTDPKTQEKSVSLTLLMVSFALVCVLGVLQSVGKVNSVGPFMDLFITTTALYFSRRIDLNTILTSRKPNL